VGGPNRYRTIWTDQEDGVLCWLWGECRVSTLARKLGRSQCAIVERAKVLGLGNMWKGKLTLTQVAEHLGCTDKTVKRLVARSGMRLEDKRVFTTTPKARREKGRVYAFSLEDVDLLIETLKRIPNPNYVQAVSTEGWGAGNKPVACLDCGGTERPHKGRGLCVRCYMRRKRAGTLDIGDRPRIRGGLICE
jgi:hypothetical protein